MTPIKPTMYKNTVEEVYDWIIINLRVGDTFTARQISDLLAMDTSAISVALWQLEKRSGMVRPMGRNGRQIIYAYYHKTRMRFNRKRLPPPRINQKLTKEHLAEIPPAPSNVIKVNFETETKPSERLFQFVSRLERRKMAAGKHNKYAVVTSWMIETLLEICCEIEKVERRNK